MVNPLQFFVFGPVQHQMLLLHLHRELLAAVLLEDVLVSREHLSVVSLLEASQHSDLVLSLVLPELLHVSRVVEVHHVYLKREALLLESIQVLLEQRVDVLEVELCASDGFEVETHELAIGDTLAFDSDVLFEYLSVGRIFLGLLKVLEFLYLSLVL